MVYVKAEEREEQIAAAAVRVLSSVGVPAMTLRAVAAAADIPLGTLNYVFPTKDQLLRCVILRQIHTTSEVLRAELELNKGVEHALRHGVTSFWHKLVSDEIGMQIMEYELMTYSLRNEAGGDLAQLQRDRYSLLVTEFLEQAARAAGERCAVGFDTLGRLTLAQVDGLILQYIAKPDAALAQRDLESALDMLVLFADPQPVARADRARSPVDA